MSLGLTSSGVLWEWGQTQAGQALQVPTEVRAEVAEVAVAGNGGHLLVVDTAGELSGRGANDVGQLGLGDAVDRGAFSSVGEGFTLAASGHAHSLFLSAEGTAWGAGAAGDGQLGTGRGAHVLEAIEGP